ncbi:MAG: metallophosphoesterase [Solirubrobacteraceae bacterium]
MRWGAPFLLAVLTALATGCGSQSSVEVAAPPLTLAVIGDTPYGPQQLAAFPRLIRSINDNASVDVVLHLGDIKTG